MIKDTRPLNMQETRKILESLKDKDDEKKKQLSVFMKKFIKSKAGKSKEISKEIESLGLLKMKQENIVKIIDLMPEDAADLNKIFTDTTLNEEETNKILEIVKKYK